jgi:hypothetical protein
MPATLSRHLVGATLLMDSCGTTINSQETDLCDQACYIACSVGIRLHSARYAAALSRSSDAAAMMVRNWLSISA